MRKLSESFIDDVIRRSRTGEDRNEDKKNLNISDLQCWAFLGGVYWASEQLTIDDQYCISIKEFKEINPAQLKGWRLPTIEEFEKMIDEAYIYSSSAYTSFAFEKPGKEGHFVELSSCEHMQVQEEDGYNTIYYSFHGAVNKEKIDEEKDGRDDYVIVVQLVRDDKI